MICDKIYRNLVITRCGHTFCKECIEKDIKENNGKFGEFGQQLVHKRGRGKSTNIDIFDFCADNKSLFNIINGLEIKFDFVDNECEEVVGLEQHLNICNQTMH
jgi:hypothetical protein